jgi:DNA replication initiation complex subunit (GINS family)
MYSELCKVWKSEKTSELPQPLPIDFYSRAASYLKDLNEKSATNNVQSLQDRLAFKEKEVAERLLEEIKQIRIRKITNASLKDSTINLQDLTEKEKMFAEDLKASTTKFNEARMERDATNPQPTAVELTVIRFLQDVPEIVGVDLKMYGPYRKEDLGSLPTQNADAFIKQGVAKSVDVK